MRDLQELSELLGEEVAAAQGRLAERDAAALNAATASRPQPRPHVDLTAVTGLSDRDAARALGVEERKVSYYADRIKEVRAGLPLLPAGRQRCQAATNTMDLQCRLPSLVGEAWCRRHHSEPPGRELDKAAESRLQRDELFGRSDGRVLQALYDLTDEVEELVSAHREVMTRALNLEQAAGERRLRGVAVRRAGRDVHRPRQGHRDWRCGCRQALGHARRLPQSLGLPAGRP